ncbi:MAG: Metallo-dependent phosphatase-like protein [Linnemannia gamsii]|nr:hypothetical protein BGX24_001692 [Mortierella sp. AD032]KAK3842685.1 MAG: Metallo-dependent phosphatase-like protein [Linnemannia gamsii]
MRISASTVILSLMAAASVTAAPTPVHIEKRGIVLDKLKETFAKALTSLQCGACVSALVAAKNVSYLNRNWVLDGAESICTSFKIMDKDVCHGLVRSQGPVLVEAAMRASLLSGDGKMICFQILGACPAPAITSGTLSFPKPKPANITIKAASGNRVDVLHISDWHADDQYTVGSDAACNKPLCCRKYADSPLVPGRAAASWGDYNCDAPVKLGQDMLKFVPKVANPSFSILTGDIPPHNVWAETREMVIAEEKAAYSVIASGVTRMYPAVGNHEAAPANLLPTPKTGGDYKWLYEHLADSWTQWLPADAVNSVKNYGAYTASPAPGFRIISLNTNFCYTMNFHLYGALQDYDPFGELKWFISQLQASEDAGERVWVIGHVSPSQTDCIQNWSALYYQVVQRYSPHVIAEQFFGHSHYDEFAISYAPGAKNSQNAILTSWIAPSVSPYTDLNPGFRLYKVDTGNWNVYDSDTYVADLSKAATWDATGATPDWHLEYSAREAYGAHVPIAPDQPLSPAWWHNVTNAFESNNTAFQKYWTYRGKSANRMSECTSNTTCPKEMICDMRAGKSTDTCSGPSFGLQKREDGTEYDEGPLAADVSSIRAVFGVAKKPWNRKLCGLPSI